MPPLCTCPVCHVPMRPIFQALAPGAQPGWSWVCPQCRIERLWPDAPEDR